MLVACIAWVWSRGTSEVSSITVNGIVIDLGDAAQLTKNADHWRRMYTVNYRQSQTLDARTESIAAWLPKSVDGDGIESQIRSIAESTGLTVLAVKQGDRHVGTRVGGARGTM